MDHAARSSARPVLPLLVLLLFAAVLPAPLPGLAGASDGPCAARTDTPRRSPADTVAWLERCSRLDPDDVELTGDLGDAYAAVGDAARAEAAYRRALTLDPGYADLRRRLGRLLLQRGAAADAAHEAALALRVQPNRRALLDLQAEAKAAGEGHP